jgi:hypothetical protein
MALLLEGTWGWWPFILRRWDLISISYLSNLCLLVRSRKIIIKTVGVEKIYLSLNEHFFQSHQEVELKNKD